MIAVCTLQIMLIALKEIFISCKGICTNHIQRILQLQNIVFGNKSCKTSISVGNKIFHFGQKNLIMAKDILDWIDFIVNTYASICLIDFK